MKRLLLALFCITQLQAMELVERRSMSSKDDALQLYTNRNDFFVEDENAAYRVEKHNMNPLLNEVVKRKALGEFKNAGYLRITKLEDGKYALAAHVRGEGGGPILAGLAYGIVKVGAYAGMVAMGIGASAVVTTATAGTGAAPVVVGTIALAKSAIGATAGMSAVGSAVAVTSAGTALGTGTAAVIATSGVAGYLAAVETAAVWAAGLGMAAGPL